MARCWPGVSIRCSDLTPRRGCLCRSAETTAFKQVLVVDKFHSCGKTGDTDNDQTIITPQPGMTHQKRPVFGGAKSQGRPAIMQQLLPDGTPAGLVVDIPAHGQKIHHKYCQQRQRQGDFLA
jgi:hypothetical protein